MITSAAMTLLEERDAVLAGTGGNGGVYTVRALWGCLGGGSMRGRLASAPLA